MPGIEKQETVVFIKPVLVDKCLKGIFELAYSDSRPFQRESLWKSAEFRLVATRPGCSPSFANRWYNDFRQSAAHNCLNMMIIFWGHAG